MNPEDLTGFYDGDSVVFRSAVERESPRLLHFAQRLTRGDRDEAEELVQETWVKAYRERRSYRADAPLLSWLIAICRSLYLSRIRTADRRAELLTEGGISAGNPIDSTPLTPLLRRRLADAVAALSDRQRAVVILRLVEGLSTRACATRLGVPEGTIKSTLHRALETLKPMLEDLR